MKASFYLCAAALVALGSPAFAGDGSATSAPQAAAPEQPKPEKLICKRDSTVGTRLSQSICLTRAQWRARDRALEENKNNLVDKINGAAATPMPNGSGG